jgi:hypothetical protein
MQMFVLGCNISMILGRTMGHQNVRVVRNVFPDIYAGLCLV